MSNGTDDVKTLRERLEQAQRERDSWKAKHGAASKEIEGLRATENVLRIRDAVRGERAKAQVRDIAEEDALLAAEAAFEVVEWKGQKRVLTKGGNGITPGATADVWFHEMRAKRPHWWSDDAPASASPSKVREITGPNPWRADSWNLTQQMAFFTKHGEARAEQMAAAAGTKLGAPRPTGGR